MGVSEPRRQAPDLPSVTSLSTVCHVVARALVLATHLHRHHSSAATGVIAESLAGTPPRKKKKSVSSLEEITL